jgi:flagellar hook assembly protein FlgD
MSIQSVTNAPASTTTTDNTSLTGLGKQEFLNILMAQLKYQNPMDPMKPDQFLSQLSQLTQVEQITNIAETLDKMSKNSGTSDLAQWLSVVGKKVNVNATSVLPGDQVVLTPSGDYDKISVQLKDANNNVVDETTLQKGDNLTFTYSGTQQVTVSATAVKNNTPVGCTYTTFSPVAGVQMGDSGPMVVLNNGQTYAVSSIKQITQ